MSDRQSTTTEKHLWEYDHPYYCNEGNYLASPVRDAELDCWAKYESWQDFYEEWGESDPDYNLVFRWDWHAMHLEWPEDYPGGEHHVLKIFLLLQRKAFNKSAEIRVAADDEPAVREWLEERAKTMAAIWAPFSVAVSA